MPITTSASGYAYVLLESKMGVSGKICYYLNDSATNATNIGTTLNTIGPLGTYEYLYRWNFELQTNFTMADSTDYSLEIGRTKALNANTDP